MFNPEIQQADILNNKELSKLFMCGNMGGMRRSHKTNTLVIVSDHTKGLYDDKWVGNDIHYTGMGAIGDQSVTFSQNRTLNESDSNGVAVHLFEVYKAGEYVYQGEVKLSGKPYQEQQPDKEDNARLTWMFPLALVTGKPVRFKEGLIEDIVQKRIRSTEKLSNLKIKSIAEGKTPKGPTFRETISTTYDRDPVIVQYALKRANGVCQLCDAPAPFNKKNGEPYLEVHHIQFLSEEGSDTIDNVAALCPNCHRKIHALKLKKDIKKLELAATQKLKEIE
jgi:5-methylcytosine-specific restriction protein A